MMFVYRRDNYVVIACDYHEAEFLSSWHRILKKTSQSFLFAFIEFLMWLFNLIFPCFL